MTSTPRKEPGPTSTVTTPSDRDIRIERIFNAPRDRVWRAYTDPKLVAQWWGRGNKLVIERMEVERGGHWRFVEHGPEGVHGFEGRFREVTPPTRIVQTFEWDGMPGYVVVNTATFEDLGGDDTMNKVTPFLMFNDQLEAAVKDPRKVEAVIDAMMKMVKLDVAALERAYAGA